MELHCAYMPIKIGILVCRASLTQDYLTCYAQDLDEIRALWMAMVQRREALLVRHAHAIFSLMLLASSMRLQSRGLLLVPSN